MNTIERFARKIDGAQQRNKGFSVIFGVVKKFGDDNAGTLVGSLAATAFGSIFPLLLLLFTVLGLVLDSHSGLRADVLHSTLRQFPIIGTDLGNNIKALHRDSAVGLTVGIAGLAWGSLGLAQNGIFTMEQIWNLPGVDRPNYLKRLYRSVTFLVVLGVGLMISTFLAAAVPTARGAAGWAIAGAVASAVVNFAEYLFAFRVLTPARVSVRQLVPGAALAGVAWTVLQAMGGFVIGRYLKNDNAVYGLFGIVLGLYAWVYLITEVTVYAAELNVVLARHLWPRSMVQPPLTDADRRSLTAQAAQHQQRREQRIEVSFGDESLTGDPTLPVEAGLTGDEAITGDAAMPKA
ncbi:MAG: YihY/virulence factor BrkB family protein [Acidimicrobiales bacterium]